MCMSCLKVGEINVIEHQRSIQGHPAQDRGRTQTTKLKTDVSHGFHQKPGVDPRCSRMISSSSSYNPYKCVNAYWVRPNLKINGCVQIFEMRLFTNLF